MKLTNKIFQNLFKQLHKTQKKPFSYHINHEEIVRFKLDSKKRYQFPQKNQSNQQFEIQYQERHIDLFKQSVQSLHNNHHKLQKNLIPQFSSNLSKIKEKNIPIQEKKELQIQLSKILQENLNYQDLKGFQNYYSNIVTNLQNKFQVFSKENDEDGVLLYKVMGNVIKMKGLDHVSGVQFINFFGKMQGQVKLVGQLQQRYQEVQRVFSNKIERDIEKQVLKRYLVKELVMVLWGIQKMGIQKGHHVDKFFDEIQLKQRDITYKDLAILIGLLVQQNNIDKILMLQNIYCSNVGNIKMQRVWPRDISTIIWGFSKLQHYLDIQTVEHLVKSLKVQIQLFQNPQDIALAMVALIKIRQILRGKHGEILEKQQWKNMYQEIDRIHIKLCDLFFKDVILQKNKGQNSGKNKAFFRYKQQDIVMFVKGFLQSQMKEEGKRMYQLKIFLEKNQDIIKDEYLGQIFIGLGESKDYLDMLEQYKEENMIYFMGIEELLTKNKINEKNIGDILLSLSHLNSQVRDMVEEKIFVIFEEFLSERKNLPVQQFCHGLAYLEKSKKMDKQIGVVLEYLLSQDNDYFVEHPLWLSVAQLNIKNTGVEISDFILNKFINMSDIVLKRVNQISDKRGIGNIILNLIRFQGKKNMGQKVVNIFEQFFKIINRYGGQELDIQEIFSAIKGVELFLKREDGEDLQGQGRQCVDVLNENLVEKILKVQKFEDKGVYERNMEYIRQVFKKEVARKEGNLLKCTYEYLQEKEIQV